MTQLVSAKPEIKWAFDPWAPLHQQDDSGKTRGLLVEIIKAVLTDEMNFDVKYNQLPWKRSQLLVKSGEMDFMVTVPTEERLKYTIMSKEPVYSLDNKIYTYTNHPRIEEIQKIKTVQDIIDGKFQVLSYLGNGWFEQNIAKPGVNVYYTGDYHAVLGMLSLHRADLTVDIEPTTNSYIYELKLNDKIVNTNVTMGSMKLHLLISKKSKYANIIQQFDEVYEKLVKNGTIDKIIDKHAEQFK